MSGLFFRCDMSNVKRENTLVGGLFEPDSDKKQIYMIGSNCGIVSQFTYCYDHLIENNFQFFTNNEGGAR